MKLEFPVNVDNPQPTYEIQFGVISRPADGEEEPGLHWFDVSGEAECGGQERGLAIINDAKYSYDVTGNRMRLTVLRSPVYAHHDPRELKTGAFYHFIDQGIQKFTYRLAPHAGSWQEANAPKLALELNAPMMVLEEYNHPGQLPGRYTGLDVSAPNIVVSAVKESEDGNGYVVRAYEAHGLRTECSFRWNQGAIKWNSEFGAFEIKTFLVDSPHGKPVVELDLIERPLS